MPVFIKECSCFIAVFNVIIIISIYQVIVPESPIGEATIKPVHARACMYKSWHLDTGKLGSRGEVPLLSAH